MPLRFANGEITKIAARLPRELLQFEESGYRREGGRGGWKVTAGVGYCLTFRWIHERKIPEKCLETVREFRKESSRNDESRFTVDYYLGTNR